MYACVYVNVRTCVHTWLLALMSVYMHVVYAFMRVCAWSPIDAVIIFVTIIIIFVVVADIVAAAHCRGLLITPQADTLISGCAASVASPSTQCSQWRARVCRRVPPTARLTPRAACKWSAARPDVNVLYEGSEDMLATCSVPAMLVRPRWKITAKIYCLCDFCRQISDFRFCCILDFLD